MLDVDRDLAEGLDPEREAVARRHLTARLVRVDAGLWTPKTDAFGAQGGLGLLVSDGLAVRRVALGHRAAAELLGSGDVMQPWEEDGEHAAYPFEASFRVVEALSLLVLDATLTQRLMHFPEIVARLMGRVMARSRRVVGHLAVAQLASVDTRLHVVLWHLADRFGHVGPEGVSVPLRITHETLGLVIGARRPSVTAALGRLTDHGLVQTRAPAGWLLTGEPPADIARMRSIRGAVPLRA